MTEMTDQKGKSKNPVRVTRARCDFGALVNIENGAKAVRASLTIFTGIEVLWVDWP